MCEIGLVSYRVSDGGPTRMPLLQIDRREPVGIEADVERGEEASTSTLNSFMTQARRRDYPECAETKVEAVPQSHITGSTATGPDAIHPPTSVQ